MIFSIRNIIFTQHSSCHFPPTFLTAKLPDRTGSSLTKNIKNMLHTLERKREGLTCNMVEQQVCSRSGQTWVEACQACQPCLLLFPQDCSHSPPCKTHDSGPVLDVTKLTKIKDEMSTSSPASSSLKVAVARRSNFGPAILCSLSWFSSFS